MITVLTTDPDDVDQRRHLGSYVDDDSRCAENTKRPDPMSIVPNRLQTHWSKDGVTPHYGIRRVQMII